MIVDHLETVAGSFCNVLASHLLMIPFSANTAFIQFKFAILYSIINCVKCKITYFIWFASMIEEIKSYIIVLWQKNLMKSDVRMGFIC